MLGKLAIEAFAGTSVIVPLSIYLPAPWSVELTQEKLEEFKKSKGFESCYTFLSNKDKYTLLFTCLKPKNNSVDNSTFVSHYYFYNGGSWEEAKDLRKNPKGQPKEIFFVTTSTWLGERIRSIKNSDESQSNLELVNTSGMICTFGHSEVKKSSPNSKEFYCFKGHRTGELKWKLQEFK